MKLNLGCGNHVLAGFVNVDVVGEPDLRFDLEETPWPWADGEVGEVLLTHVLEHLGREPKTFLAIMGELYRVCAPDATIRITVPHPRHDHFLDDPTHVRPITPKLMTLFSKKACEMFVRQGYANSPLALTLGVDFELASVEERLDERWKREQREGRLNDRQMEYARNHLNNVVEAYHMVLRVVKDGKR